MDFSKNNITNLCGTQSYLKAIFGMWLRDSNIRVISDDILDTFQQGKIEMLDLQNNLLQRLPLNIQNVATLSKIWLSNNPFICDCNMLWMKDWMFNKSREMIVQDPYEVKCPDGDSIDKLDPVKMGCYPNGLTLLQKFVIGLSAVVTVAIVIAIIAISRRWNEVKWFVYLHFNILGKNDGNEDLANKEYDALLSYWQVLF